MALPVQVASCFGVLEHCKISNFKHQITNKSQIPIFNDRNRFGILKLGPRPQGGESKRSADNFGHCDLLFGISGTPVFQQTAARGKENGSPSGSSAKPGSMGPDSSLSGFFA